MTLIIAVLTHDRVVQVSDRRLSRPDGTLFDDEANKAITVSCKDASFAVAYTGLGIVGRERTDKWLTNYLVSIDAAGKRLTEIAMCLQTKLASLRRRRVPRGAISKLTLMLAGFWGGQAFAGVISNAEESKLLWLRHDRKRKDAVAELVRGAAIDRAIHQRIKKLKRQRFFQKAEGEAVAERLVSLVRAATRTARTGGYIGRNCMSVTITPLPDYPKNCELRSSYHPDGQRSIAYGPNRITYWGTFTDIEIGSWDGEE